MEFDVVIVGGGIVGLATGYQLQNLHPGLRIAVLEKEENTGLHQTSHNSGVIHSGIYYRPGSLKASNCREGYRELLSFCEQHHVPFEICGKVIVATHSGEIPMMEEVYNRGRSNGLSGLRILEREELADIEPHVRGERAIWVPQAGIIDFAQVATRLSELIVQRGGEIICQFQVVGILSQNGTVSLISGEKVTIRSKWLISCAGLYSDILTAMTHPDPGFRILPFRGEYYTLKPNREHLIRRLVYPVPDIRFPFLGIHFTRRIHGGVEAGPNAVLAFAREGYGREVDPGNMLELLRYRGFRRLALKHHRFGIQEFWRSWNKRKFVQAMQKLIPGITADDVQRGRTGVRAQACDPNGNLIEDFYIREQERIIHVCNAPSPAATSCLSIGRSVAQRLIKKMEQ